MKNSILSKVLIAILLALVAGWITGPEKALFGIPYLKFYHFIGQLFLNALHMVAIPLVSASIILGTTRMGSESSFGILGVKTFGLYLFTSFLAVLVGVCGFFLIFPRDSVEHISVISKIGEGISQRLNRMVMLLIRSR